MNTELKTLIDRFPVPGPWSFPEVYEDEIDLGDFSLKMIGLAADASADFPSVTASAVSLEESPVVRAYFELLERMSICLAERSQKGLLKKIRLNGQTTPISKEEVFPKSPNPQEWIYSRSNGVSAHVDFNTACQKAAFELFERDAILRSWQRMAGVKRRLPLERKIPQLLKENYELDTYLFDEQVTALGRVFVCGTFAFPLNPNFPFFCGFGASLDSEDAQYRSFRESLQRFGFLHGEATPTLVEFSPTPEFHLDYYWNKANQVQLRNWLETGQTKANSSDHSSGYTASHTLGHTSGYSDYKEELFFRRSNPRMLQI